MTIMQNPMRLKTLITYDAAADHFDHPCLGFWHRHGKRTVALLAPSPGISLLDVGCGTGASALPAATAVGPGGHVTGIDVAENMLERARAKAEAQSLENVTFRLADMADLSLSDERFDAIISVFSIFFVPDMTRQVAALWRVLRPGGQLAITVWAQDAFEPAASIFGQEVRRVRPDLPVSGRPWGRLTDPESFRQLLLESGTSEPRIQVIGDSQPLAQPGDWWTIAMGSGYRWEIDQLTLEQRETVKSRTIERLADQGTAAIETGALCAIARKPGRGSESDRLKSGSSSAVDRPPLPVRHPPAARSDG